ncbi:longitudinals lacking protein, isoforms A/B/D/L isoform X7 [Ischnura elegans]|uniref:longitudinals lacking protein, isoforms A/B/D/L isoform X7 n=1 Tax=Ischnura elegans TaxID=197161 RepID=UPI001ED8AFF2|nr:longitudinals lacking protein, isoforms A/B/D/L isoform X7 [Ischnura elegans]
MGSEQQFCLRWNNHQSTLISVFDTLLESETLVDVTLAAEGQYLKAHKVVLSACSQYFQELLCHHLEKHPIIILKDVTFQELKALIDYMYRGEVNVSQEQLSALIKTAESLKIKGLADGGDRRPDRKSVPQLSPPLPPVLGPALSGNLSLDNRSMGAGEYATNSPLQHGPREGSISPVSRKRKRIRRRSGEGVAGGGAHEGEVGGGSEQASSSASTLSVPNIPATITPVNSGSRTTPGDGDGGDDEGVAGSKLDGGQEDGVQGPASSKQTKSEPGTSLQSHSRTPLLEPKSEYREEDDDDGEADEDSMDNVVALDEDVMDMEGSRDDGLDQKAGPSHGAEVSGQGSGFAPWHMMPDRSGDDIFIPSQESAAQRESQGLTSMPIRLGGEFFPPDMKEFKSETNVEFNEPSGYGSQYLLPCNLDDSLLLPKTVSCTAVDSSDTKMVELCLRTRDQIGASSKRQHDGYWLCDLCGRSYMQKSSLLRHKRFECGKEASFACPFCPARSFRASNLARHIRSIHPRIGR